MDPEIRYARTSDQVDIAYWRIGSGPVVIQLPLLPYSHIEREWRVPDLQAWDRRLARGATLLRYDGRGTGSSQREVTGVSAATHLLDLEAVVAAAGPDPVTLLGVFHTGPAAIAFAAAHPDRVERLILWCTYARGADYWRAQQSEALRALRQSDPSLFRRTAAHELMGWDAGAKAEAYADVMESAVSAEMADAIIAATRTVDVSGDLARVACPTLVVHRRDLGWIDISLSRNLAGSIPGARLGVVDGRSPLPGAGDLDSAIAPIEEFLGIGSPGGPAPRSAVQTILFTDLVDHTSLMTALGDEAGRLVVRRHDAIVRAAISAHGGREVKGLGDGFLASFTSVTGALEAAITIQRDMAEWNRQEQPHPPVAVRIGLQAGEPVEEDGDVFGATVILAARIAARAGGGEILAGSAVRELATGKRFDLEDAGEFLPKGFDAPVRVWRVGW